MRNIRLKLETFNSTVNDLIFESAYVSNNNVYMVWKLGTTPSPNAKSTQFKVIEANQILPHDVDKFPITHYVSGASELISQIAFNKHCVTDEIAIEDLRDKGEQVASSGTLKKLDTAGTESTITLENRPFYDVKKFREVRHQQFLQQMEVLRLKVESLEEETEIFKKSGSRHFETYDKASKAGRQLLEDLHTACNHYYGLEKFNETEFSAKCSLLINKARPALEGIRDWKYILKNLAMVLVCGVVGYPGAILVNKATAGGFLFFKTENAQILDAVGTSIKTPAQS